MKQEKKCNIHQIFWYFFIFSIIGLMIETIYCYATVGVIESRKGLLWGPFCPIYGVSAAILMLALDKYKNKNLIQLFLYGFIVGSLSEYILSYGLEAIYGTRFWNYEYTNFHINGRICLQFSLYWGILTIVIIKLIKPFLDSLINGKIRNSVEIILMVFLSIDCLVTIWGIQTYQNRLLTSNDPQVVSTNIFSQLRQTIEEQYFTNERISTTFPNLRVKDKQGNEIWLKTLIQETKDTKDKE